MTEQNNNNNNNNNKHTSVKSASHLEVYLFYNKIGKTEKKGNFADFFDKLDELDKDLTNSIVFLESDTAWQYSRFMDTSHAVLKLYLPQTAIAGHSHGLTVKKGFVTKQHIHGCFPGWAKGLIFIKNPFFDEQLMTAN